jgi:polysaccharide biosynthesis/export protein
MRHILIPGFALLISALVSPSLLSAPVESVETAGYQLGPGDKLRITVYNEPSLTGEYALTSEGNVSIPLIGDVAASQLTLTQLQNAITGKLSAYVKEPRVSIEQLNYRSYYVLGEVNKPGQYAFATGLRVDQAVAAAGGFTYRANRGTVFVRRGDKEREDRLKIKQRPALVMPGDTIRVGERFF